MENEELLKRINEMVGTEYKSLDDISHHSLLAIYGALLIELLHQNGVDVQIFQCNPSELTNVQDRP
jgi:hypothetical protein